MLRSTWLNCFGFFLVWFNSWLHMCLCLPRRQEFVWEDMNKQLGIERVGVGFFWDSLGHLLINNLDHSGTVNPAVRACFLFTLQCPMQK